MNIKVGDRVRLTGNVLHKEFAGLTGVIKRIVKSRGVVTVLCDNGKRYDALPENVEVITVEISKEATPEDMNDLLNKLKQGGINR